MSGHKLFEDFVRTHDGVARHSEDTFSFLDRSARPACERVRAALNDWYGYYPDAHEAELKGKFRHDFSAAFFELLLHELLRRVSHNVEVHPSLPSSQRTHPDFRAQDSSAKLVFFEAAVVTDESEEEKRRSRVLSVLYDEISKLELPDYFLDIDIHNPTGKQPSGKKLRQFISGCVQNLNYDELCALSELGAIHELPRWTYKEDNFEIDFGVIPVSRESRGKLGHRPIGIYPGGIRLGGGEAAIRSKITKKAGKYGRLSCAYIIAVNCLGGFGTDRRDELRALFGAEKPIFSYSGTALRLSGKIDGAWYGLNGPRNRRVSGVLLTRVFPWNLPKAEVTLYHNPWADYRYEGPLTNFPQVRLMKNSLEATPGNSFGSVFSLPDDWPGQLFEN
jgi:hypothetical protein